MLLLLAEVGMLVKRVEKSNPQFDSLGFDGARQLTCPAKIGVPFFQHFESPRVGDGVVDSQPRNGRGA